MSEPLLKIRELTKIYGGGLFNPNRTLALDHFNFTIDETPPRVTAIAGESGSGKTTLANLLLKFVDPTGGHIFYRGRDVWEMSRQEIFDYRREVQGIFQDPYGTYNPFYKVDNVFDIVINKFKLADNREEAYQLRQDALEVVGLRPGEILGKYPHQLSGGQRQRIMVARAFLLKPKLIVADEPVSMIDASLQVRILKIFRRLKEDYGISFLYITHDLSTAYQISDDIFILYRGSVMERGMIEDITQSPKHPYTQMLISAVPVPNPHVRWQGRLEAVKAMREEAPHGCKFYSRCPDAMPVCVSEPPPLYKVGDQQYAACYLYEGNEILEEEAQPTKIA